MARRCAIIGAGRLGRTLGTRLLAAGGWEITYGSRHPPHSHKLKETLHAQPAAHGSGIGEAVEWVGPQGVVLLTVPGSALCTDTACASLARSLGPHAAGKVVIDATNPLDFDGTGLCWQRGCSSAEVLQQALPESFVYKAFNTVPVENMEAPDGSLVTGERLGLMYAGAAERQEEVGELVSAVGFRPHYVGPVRYARNLEALAELVIHLGSGMGGVDWAEADGTRRFHLQPLRQQQGGTGGGGGA